MKVKIAFTHEARPYISPDEYENIQVELSAGVLPNKGEEVTICGITHPAGSFVVAYRVFEINPQTHDMYAILGLGLAKD